jgi:hypothetical protein
MTMPIPSKMSFLHSGDGRLGAWLESVGQATLATVLTVIVEGHLRK